MTPRILGGLALVFGVGLAACSTTAEPVGAPAAKVAPSDVDRISYSISTCHGTCPAYRFEIAADGIAFFEGEQHTASSGRTPVNGDPMLFRRIKEALAPAMPGSVRSVSHETCAQFATDQQVVTVTWAASGQSDRTLTFDLGCHDAALASLRGTLSAARRLLPIDRLVGRATEF